MNALTDWRRSDRTSGDKLDVNLERCRFVRESLSGLASEVKRLTMKSRSRTNETPLPGGRPIVLYGGEATWLGSLGSLIQSASAHEFYSVDIDLRSSWLAPSWPAVASQLSRHMIRVRSVWIAGMLAGPLVSQRTDRLMEFLKGCRRDHGLRTVVIPRAAHIRRGSSLGPLIRQFAAERGGPVPRVAVGIRAIDLGAERGHLDHLRSIRHLAEEWDLDVALDLTGQVPRDWEAEAAIMRLLPRLALVRITPQSGDGLYHRPMAARSMAARSVAILADQGYTGPISLASPVHPLRSLVGSGGPGELEIMARDAVLDQYDRQRRTTHHWDIAKRLTPPEVI